MFLELRCGSRRPFFENELSRMNDGEGESVGALGRNGEVGEEAGSFAKCRRNSRMSSGGKDHLKGTIESKLKGRGSFEAERLSIASNILSRKPVIR